MKKLTAVVLACVLALSVCACSKSEDSLTKVKIGASTTPHAQILLQIVDDMKELGYELEVVEYQDYVLPNTGVNDGELDANYFQHQPYLDDFNAENGTKVVSIAKLHYEPFGIYPGKKSTVADLAAGDQIGIPNDGTNEGRALHLLEQEGVITLKEGTGLTATLADVESYIIDVTIVEMEAAQIPRALQDLALGVINGNYAINAGLNVAKDAIAVEAADGLAATTYGNVLCVKEGNENADFAKALIQCLETDKIRDYINDTFEGAVVPLF